jgi:hypothetical protein
MRRHHFSAFLRGIKMYHDNNMLENARARHKAVAIVVSIEDTP